MQCLCTSPRSVASLARAVSRRPPQQHGPPVFADAFQRLLTAHRKPVFCVVCLPAIGDWRFSVFSATAHSTSSITGPLSGFTCFPCAHSTQDHNAPTPGLDSPCGFRNSRARAPPFVARPSSPPVAGGGIACVSHPVVCPIWLCSTHWV
jgi:hypothetical protein